MREHRALGPAGRAGGVDDDRQVGLGAARATGAELWTSGFGLRCAWLPALPVARLRNSFKCGPGGLQRAVMRAQFGVGDQHVDAGVVQDVIHLVRLEEVVDRHHDRAGVQDAEQGRDELRAVLEPQPHPVAGLDAKVPLELVGDEGGLAPQFGVGILAFAPEEGDFLRLLLNGFRKGGSQIHGRAILRRRLARRQGRSRLRPGHNFGMALSAGGKYILA